MALENVTKEIYGQTVVFTGVDTLLADKLNQLLDFKVQREIPLDKLREEIAGFGWPSTIEGEPAEAAPPVPDKVSHVKLKPVKGKRGRKPGDKAAKALELIKRMDADGKPEKEILKALQKELDIPYPNAYYYWKKVYKKS